ncbi:hypothetical protein GOP47_0023465 [Adiantum capillus-veneris]|uniref:Uncharacterized protein n=1 Tax=Adiantum capillus-veneris TaxID=13818 RepID=A0A9D4U4J2_ADICA|nr:hypothetical protein GOP47_0023465 [Adiantum capillus-veneris]
MSCLLLKTSGNLEKEVVKATHEEVLGEINYEQILQGCSCWSISDQPSCVVHGDCREGGGWEESAVRSAVLQPGICSSIKEELQTGIFPAKNDHQEILESRNILTKPECNREQQLAWQEYIVDELVCKLISQLQFPPELCSQKREVQELNNQKGDIQGGKVPASSVDAEISKICTSLHTEGHKGPLPLELPEHAVSTEGCHHDPAKVRSALRAGYEKSGLGHRPQKHVTWAADVYDPPCTSTSHTSSQNRRRHHHHPKSEHKNRHKGKGNGHTEKKSQKKLYRRLKHTGESFSSGSTVFSQRGQQSSPLRLKEFVAPSLDDLTLKGSRVGPFISLQKACFLSPVLSLVLFEQWCRD